MFLLSLIPFFHSEPTEKNARGPAGNRAWPINLDHHNLAHYFNVALVDGSYFSILPNPFFHSGTNLKVLGPRQESISLRRKALHPSPNIHYPPWQEANAFSFFIPPNPFFSIKELAAQSGIEPCSVLEW